MMRPLAAHSQAYFGVLLSWLSREHGFDIVVNNPEGG